MRLFPLFSYLLKKSGIYCLLAIIFLGLAVMSSCRISRSATYFKTLVKDTTLTGFISNDFESKIQKKDVLGITVSSMSKEMDEKFNAAALVVNQSAQSALPGYLVNEQGSITVHFLGAIPAEGLTRKELKEKLEKSLLPYLKDPIITVQYLNHKVTVLGEVTKPQVLNMPEEQLSLIDVIVSSGDVKEQADRKKIMIVRESKNEKIVKYVNLEDNSIFSSPWYYIQPNDIVYVMPDNKRYVKEEKRKRIQTTLSLVASLASLAITIVNYILR
ncbi:MAG: polysaccharide biosynthesis/export family protein [Ferruginibacter sp.]